MSEINNGGPAFPAEKRLGWEASAETNGKLVPIIERFPGMSLRDYFAAQALSALIAKESHLVKETIALRAYAIADAMLIARNHK